MHKEDFVLGNVYRYIGSYESVDSSLCCLSSFLLKLGNMGLYIVVMS